MLSVIRNIVVIVVGSSVLILSTLQAQDAKIVADNIEFSRDFYSGVHFSAISESAPSFGYQRYPDNGPERIQCDAGTFARSERGKPWLKSKTGARPDGPLISKPRASSTPGSNSWKRYSILTQPK